MKSTGIIDPKDRQILEALSVDARISMTDLAKQVNLSRPAVQARIARLEGDGVIRGYHADVRFPLEGSGHRAILFAKIGVRPCAPALAYLRGLPEVRQLWSVAGPHDAVIEVVTGDPNALSVLSDRLLASPFRIEAEAQTVLGAFQGTMEPAP